MKNIKKFNQFNILEELNTQGTYFTKNSDIEKKIEVELKNIINLICDKYEIVLPIEPWKKEFLLIKKDTILNIKENDLINDLIENDLIENDLNKIIDKYLLKICSNKEHINTKTNNKKINITHLDFKLIDNVDNVETYQVIFPEDVKNHIINNNSTNKLDYLIYINCESDKFNRLHFPGRIDRWYRSHGKRFGKDEQPQPYKGKHGKWITDLFDGIPESLRGTGIGYSIYKEFIKFKGYVSSNSWSSTLSQSVWKKLSTDPDLFGILVNYKGQDGDIILFSKSYKGDYKKICNEFINYAKKGLLYRGNPSQFEIVNIEIDNELQNKI